MYEMIGSQLASEHHCSHYTGNSSKKGIKRDMKLAWRRLGLCWRGWSWSELWGTSRLYRYEGQGEILGRVNTATICDQAGATSYEKYLLEDLIEFPDLLLGLEPYKISKKLQGWTETFEDSSIGVWTYILRNRKSWVDFEQMCNTNRAVFLEYWPGRSRWEGHKERIATRRPFIRPLWCPRERHRCLNGEESNGNGEKRADRIDFFFYGSRHNRTWKPK